MGSLGFLSSYHVDFREPLVLPQGREVSFQVARGYFGIPLELLQGNGASSRIESGNSGFLSSLDGHLGVSIEFQLGIQASSHFEARKSAFHSSLKGVSGLLSS